MPEKVVKSDKVYEKGITEKTTEYVPEKSNVYETGKRGSYYVKLN